MSCWPIRALKMIRAAKATRVCAARQGAAKALPETARRCHAESNAAPMILRLSGSNARHGSTVPMTVPPYVDGFGQSRARASLSRRRGEYGFRPVMDQHMASDRRSVESSSPLLTQLFCDDDRNAAVDCRDPRWRTRPTTALPAPRSAVAACCRQSQPVRRCALSQRSSGILTTRKCGKQPFQARSSSSANFSRLVARAERFAGSAGT